MKNFANRIVKRILRDKHSHNDEDEDPKFFGPKRKAKENEKWVPFKVEGKQAFYLKKNTPTFNEVKDIMSSSFLTQTEKENKARELGASETTIRMASNSEIGRKVNYRGRRW
jgi:hypothetical protein